MDTDKIRAAAENEGKGSFDSYLEYIACCGPDTVIALLDASDEKDELIFAYDQTRTPIIDKTIIDLQAENIRLRNGYKRILKESNKPVVSERSWEKQSAEWEKSFCVAHIIASQALNPARRKK